MKKKTNNIKSWSQLLLRMESYKLIIKGNFVHTYIIVKQNHGSGIRLNHQGKLYENIISI